MAQRLGVAGPGPPGVAERTGLGPAGARLGPAGLQVGVEPQEPAGLQGQGLTAREPPERVD